jgi:glycosyltransferase involved in cell wall biosynthesis
MQLAAGVEVLVLDDGSSRGITAWLAERGKDWPALRAIKTAGATPARARNAAIEAARASLIAFLDPACWWWPNKLAEQAGYHAANPETAFSFTDYLQVAPGGESCGTCFNYWQPSLGRRNKPGYFQLADALQITLATNFVGTSTVMASKAALEKAGGFSDLPAASEWDLWLRLAAKSPVACSKAVTATYPSQAEIAPSLEPRIEAMGEILSFYESSRVASIRHAAAKARAQLDCARAELSRPVRRYASMARAVSRALVASTQAKAANVSAALNFAGAYGAGK